MIAKFMTALRSFFASIAGTVSWNSPPWVRTLSQRAKSGPGAFTLVIMGLIAFIAASIFTWQWYSHLPKQARVSAKITTPRITPLTEEEALVPDNLLIAFGVDKEGEFQSRSAAPLGNVDKAVTEGIRLKPELKGKWVWQGDSKLLFTPENDWPADQKYTVYFDKNFFAPDIKMAQMQYSFHTEPFTASIESFRFYQDPVKPDVRQAVATINFNYPVNTNTVLPHISLHWQSLKKDKNLERKPPVFSVTYDKFKRKAFLHTENLTLPENSEYLVLQINNGIKAASSDAETTTAISQNTLIPDKTSYLKITTAEASIIRNPKDRPEQILNLEFTVGVSDAVLNKALHVYLLPENYPATAAEKEKLNYEWTNPGEITPDILALATPLELQPLPTDQNYAALHSYKFQAKTPRYMYVKLDKGLMGFGDFSMDRAWSAIIKVPELPKEISFLHKGALMALGGEQKLSVLVRGVGAVKFEYARVLPENINQLITQTQGDFNNPYFINQSFNQYNISEIFSYIQEFDTSDLTRQQYTALDFSRYMSSKENAGSRGLFLLQATAWDTVNNTALDIKNNRLILVTDMAMIVKDNQNGSHDVFVQSITQGTPVSGATINILGKNGLPVLSRVTDTQGRANFPSLKDFIDERQPVVWMAYLGNDVSFIPYSNYQRELNFSRFETGGQYIFSDQAGMSAFIFSDRGIYRPGDTVHMGIIVKQGYVQPQPPGMPLQVRITDSRGTTVLDQKMTVDASGLLELDFKTSETSPTGQYFINAYIVKDNMSDGMIGSASFRVNEFQPDRMRVTAKLSTEVTEGWISPDDLKTTVNVWNLYGTPAADRTVTGKLVLSPQSIHFDKYKDYYFADPLADREKPAKVFTDNLTSLKTDEKGSATFDLQLNRFEKATWKLTFFAEAFEADGGRSVAAQATALVSSLPWLIGYKPEGDLKYIPQNSQRSLHLIAVNPTLNPVSPQGLKVQLLALQPVTTLVKKPDGTFQYQSIVHSTVLQTEPLALSDKGLNYALPTKDVGDYALLVLSENNKELTRIPFSIVGTSQKTLPRNAELQIKLDKSEYVAGEFITLQITAPYTGAGLITIERDKVYASQWFKTDATNSMQSIQIPADYEGDGYINVSFVRDWDSADVFISPLSYAVQPFSVSHKNHAMTIDLEVPAEAKPGEDLHIQYKTDVPGKIIVFAVDEGILQVAKFKTPDPLAFFFQKHALQVITQQTVDLILPRFVQERELSSVGGDGGEEALAKHLNPFKRKTALPVAFWSGILDADITPGTINYKIPDYFNGKLRVMAIGVSTNTTGSTEKSVEVRGDFIINPNVPTFVTPGDTFEITAGVANNIKQSGDLPVNVQLHLSDELELIGESSQTLTIPEGQEKTVHYTLKAKTLSSHALVGLAVSSGSKSSSMDTWLSIRPATVFSTSITSGSSTAKSKTIDINSNVYSEYRKASAAASLNPLILISGLQHFLVNFPYGCTEQLTSQGWSWLTLTDQPWSGVTAEQINAKVMEIYGKIAQRQTSSGAFSYWPDLSDNDDNDFASVYAMHFLTEAKALGYKFSPETYSAGIGYLKNMVTEHPEDADAARLQAYAIYVLTRNEIVTTNELTNLQLYLEKDENKAWEKGLTGAYIAASNKLLHNEKEATRLIHAYQSGVDDAHTTDFYNQAIANAQYLYLLSRHFPDLLSSKGPALIKSLVKAMNTQEINTTLSGYASLALGAYKDVNEGMIPPSITEILTNKQQRTLSADGNVMEKAALGNDVMQVRFDNNSGASGTWFYQVMQSAFDKIPPSTVTRAGMEITREYRDADDKVITDTTLGSELTVHIRIRALDDNYISNVAIVDLLPGGFEVVTESVKTDYLDYADVREDRVVFFTSIEPQAMEIVYRIKATNTGTFTVPGIFAESMYNPALKANSVAGKMVVK